MDDPESVLPIRQGSSHFKFNVRVKQIPSVLMCELVSMLLLLFSYSDSLWVEFL